MRLLSGGLLLLASTSCGVLGVANVDRGDHPISIRFDNVPIVEPVIAVHPSDPSRLVGAAMAVGSQDDMKVIAYWSGDGGQSWNASTLPPGNRAERPVADPWLVWPAPDRLILSMLARSTDRDGIATFVSADGGQTWQGPHHAQQPDRGHYDHPVSAVAADGFVHVAATCCRSSLAVLSGRDVAALGAPALYTPDEQNNNLGAAVALDDGTLLFTYFQMRSAGERPLFAVRFDRKSGAFTRSAIAPNVTPWGFPMLAQAPTGARRHAGRTYAVWHEGSSRAEGLAVRVAWSDDAGVTWSRPAHVVANDTQPAFRALARVVVNRTGDVAVVWFDSSFAGEARCGDIVAAVSTDGAATFSVPRRLSRASSCHDARGNGWAGERWLMGGDYLGLASSPDGSFHVTWADARDGRYQPWHARVDVRGR